jgi:hypothetical protein
MTILDPLTGRLVKIQSPITPRPSSTAADVADVSD